MLRNQREKDFPTKQEGDDHPKPPPPTSSRLWSGLKNPRIVRVSRAFGGKDRHSKVSTIRGLRDRRVRLSVPTAIQLYDLQDKLGLNQPSKVVDWLLNAAQNEIDKLPPLQFPLESFEQFSNHSTLPISSEEPQRQMISSLSNKAIIRGEGLTSTFSPYSTHWNSDALQRFKRRDEAKESLLEEKGNNNVNEGGNNSQVSPSELPLYRSSMPYATSYYQWEASNAYLSQLGIIRPSPAQSEAPPLMSILSSGSLIPQESQIVFCPPGIMPSMFSSYVTTQNAGEFDARLQNPQPNSQRD